MAVVGKVGEFTAGAVKNVDVDGVPVAVVNVDGKLYAFSDICTHLGCSLSEGDLDGSTLICDCHGGQFDVTTGEPIGGPPQEFLKTYEVSVVGDEVSIG